MNNDLFDFEGKIENEIKKKKKIEVLLTVFKSSRALNKTIGEDGQKYSNAYFADGNFNTVKIKDLLGLKKILLKIKKNEAIGLGVHKDKEKGEIAPKSRSKELARTKENFKWNNEFNLVMLDYDYFKGLTKIAGPNDFKETLEEIEPLFKDVQLLITKSTSSLVVKKDTKEALFENGGFHCYLIIKGSVDRFKELLWRSCWAKNHGAIKFAGDGSILSRTIFDAAVLSPERLVFEATPTVTGNLELANRDIRIFNSAIKKGLYLDIEQMELNLKDGLTKETNAKNAAKEMSYKLKEIYVQKFSKKLAKDSSISLDIARKIVEARTGDKGVIYEDDLIYFPDGRKILAQNLTKEHNGEYILDPIQPDKANAVLNIRDKGVNTVFSFLHGGKTFQIIPAELDTKLKISPEAKRIAKKFLKEVWNDMFGYGYSEKMYENWETIFQSYIDASKEDFKTMYVISAAAGSAKTTTLAFFIKTKLEETGGDFSSIIVVNTILNGLEFQIFLNILLEKDRCCEDIEKPKIMFSKEKEILEDFEGNKTAYKSDVNSRTCINAQTLIITHARLRKAVISNKTEYLLEYMKKGSLIPQKRDFFAVDEAIDFEEKALLKQTDSLTAVSILGKIRLHYSNKDIKEKVLKLEKIVKRFVDFCEEKNEELLKEKVLSAEDIFFDVDIDVCYDREFLDELFSLKKEDNLNLESYVTDLAILVRSKFFHLNTGTDGVIISSNVDRLPTEKGFVVLDASAVVNHEYQHYINREQAKRIRVHLDAKRYDEVTIYKSDEFTGVGKIDVPSTMINNNPNKDIKKETIETIEDFKDFTHKEILSKTDKKDKILVISNKTLAQYFKNHLLLDRDMTFDNWGNLKGVNIYKDVNKVFCLVLPIKPMHVYYGKAYKHNMVDDEHEVQKFRVSNLLDEVYQALLRANIRTNDPITKNSPKCDIYIRTSLNRKSAKDSEKLINALKKMLIGVKVSNWEFEDSEDHHKYKHIPGLAYKMRDSLLEYMEKNPHKDIISYASLHEYDNTVFTESGNALTGYNKKYISEEMTITDWIETQTELIFATAHESKKTIHEQLGLAVKGRGYKCFIRKS